MSPSRSLGGRSTVKLCYDFCKARMNETRYEVDSLSTRYSSL
jgi:hypothetical protein